MMKQDERSVPKLCEGARKGLRTSVRKAYADVPREPLPTVHVELLLALRQREREQAGRRGD